MSSPPTVRSRTSSSPAHQQQGPLSFNFRYEVQSLVLLYITRSESGMRIITRNEVRKNLERLGVVLDEERPLDIPDVPVVPDPAAMWEGLLDEIADEEDEQ